jgi:hypothetical protein
VRAHTDTAARAANRDLGAEAYTIGNEIAFASSNPDLRTVAHEAVHVIQQRAGGHRGNDQARRLELRADAAAGAVEHGRSPDRFVPEPGSRGSSVMAPVIQAKVSLRQPQSLMAWIWGSAQTTRTLATLRELMQFTKQHSVSIPQAAAQRYPSRYEVMPFLLKPTASRMVADKQDRDYFDNVTGARALAADVADEAYGGHTRHRIGGEQESPSPGSPVSLSIPSFMGGYSAGERAGSTSTFEKLSSVAEALPVPQAVGDYGSRRVRPTIQEHTPEHPVVEGMQEAFTGRAEALTRIPQDRRKAVEALQWVDYYFFAGGEHDLQRSVDIAAAKMSPEEAKKFKEDFKELKLGQELKLAASVGTGLAVGQGIGAIPHPAAKVAQVAWTATGAVALNNKLADVNEKIQQFQQAHPTAYQIMEQHRDQKLEILSADRRERYEKIKKDVTEHLASPFS